MINNCHNLRNVVKLKRHKWHDQRYGVQLIRDEYPMSQITLFR